MIRRIKDVVVLRNAKTEEHDLPYIALENIQSWDASFIESEAASEGTNNLFYAGDILFGKLRPYLAKGYLPSYDGICSTEFFVMRANETCLNKYLLYYFLSHSVIDYIKNQVAGVKMPRTNWNSFSNIPIDVPTLDEQKRRVTYLDEKCGAIDGQVELLEKKRKAYERLKTSVINNAVTRGLTPDVPMRDSGIDWIGKTPAHWELKRLKDLLSLCSGDTITSTDLVSSGQYPVYGGNGIRGSHDKYNRDGEFLLIGRVGALCGNIHLVHGKFWATEHALIGTILGNTAPAWLAYILERMKLGQYSQTTAQPVITQSKISALFLSVPPIEEQRAIATYLDEKCGEIDTTIENIGKQIDAYKRLKRALINEVVTGKRAV